MNFVEFIEARLSEDEATARKAFSPSMAGTERWVFADMQVRAADRDRTLLVKHTWPNEGEHIARHDPAAVLRRCAAAREALVTFDLVSANGPEFGAMAWIAVRDGVIKPLAAVWSEHPDYQQEWRA